jgi:hypothetical protein
MDEQLPACQERPHSLEFTGKYILTGNDDLNSWIEYKIQEFQNMLYGKGRGKRELG